MNKIMNLKEAAQRIRTAIKNKERIILYGDSDLDGVSSVIIIKETIENLGGRVFKVYFPERDKEGYGITEAALNNLQNFSPSLLVVFDCGISNLKEVEEAKKMGFEVIIVEHHEIINELPKASIIINPKQKEDKYPFKFFSSAGLAFKLAEEILGEKLTESLNRNFLELAALATLADMMPEKDDNQDIIEQGLFFFKDTFRPGLRVFLELFPLKEPGNIRAIVQEIISVLNIVEPKENNINATFSLLSANSLSEAKTIVENLLKKREEKRLKIKEIIAQIKENIKKYKKEDSSIIFESDFSWPVHLLGAVASRVCQMYKKPTFIVSKRDLNSRGAVRTPENVDSVVLMKKCSEHLLSFGGHPQASGFSIENSKLEDFKRCLIEKLDNL